MKYIVANYVLILLLTCVNKCFSIILKNKLHKVFDGVTFKLRNEKLASRVTKDVN